MTSLPIPAGCRFNRLNGLVNLDGYRVRGTLIAVEKGSVSSNVVQEGHAGVFGENP
jgi:hypothetical protein